MPEGEAKLTTVEMAKELSAMVGPERVEVYGERPEQEYRLQAPISVCPAGEQEIEAILGWACRSGVRIAPQGGGTKDSFGHIGDGVDVILSLKKMAGVLHHSVGDLTVTVLPGTTMREVQEVLGREGQFLPIDPACEAESTVGGVVAANVSGPKRALYGSARDHLIASRIVYPDGALIRTGAKVVKNVAGYDMNKLFIGAMGTLGVFTELTFKIRPIPAYAGALVVHASDPTRLWELQRMILDSQLEPCAVEWVNGRLGSQICGGGFKGPIMLIAFDDVERSVSYQMDFLTHACERIGIAVKHQYLGRGQTEAVLAQLRERLPNSNEIPIDELVVSMKLLSMMADVPAIYEFVQQTADENGLCLDFHGGCFTGISRAIVRANWQRQTEVVQWINGVEAFLEKLDGRTIIEVCPKKLKQQLKIWGRESEDWVLMRAIKSKIDPQRILNPGRFVGGI